MSTDRELLKLAAKAAGFTIVDIVESVAIVKADHPIAFKWTPLTDDGDALRLAVKLNFDVCRGLRGPDIGTAVLVMHGTLTVAEYLGDDPYAATRRAIVRAAAEIWRAA